MQGRDMTVVDVNRDLCRLGGILAVPRPAADNTVGAHRLQRADEEIRRCSRRLRGCLRIRSCCRFARPVEITFMPYQPISAVSPSPSSRIGVCMHAAPIICSLGCGRRISTTSQGRPSSSLMGLEWAERRPGHRSRPSQVVPAASLPIVTQTQILRRLVIDLPIVSSPARSQKVRPAASPDHQ